MTTRTRLAALLVAVATTATAVPALAAAPAARLTLTTLRTSGATITLDGRVTLPAHAAAARRAARVLVTLSNTSGTTERHTARLTKSRFALTWTTKLTGALTLVAQVRDGSKPAGSPITRTLTVKPTTTAHPNPGAPSTGTENLVGIFKLTPGSDPAGGTPTGSYFEMLTIAGTPLGNLQSPGGNKDFTPFTPGTQGGLSTEAYQPAPSPAFAGGSSGGALADDIIQPVSFYGVNFSVDTQATDRQTGGPDPLPVITDAGGTLSGQITAWVAQWNGQSFNQGTPKPDGTRPAPTTPLSGTYDPASGAFELQWKSRIIGGPFNGFSGLWHLTGTFVPETPASTKSGGLLSTL